MGLQLPSPAPALSTPAIGPTSQKCFPQATPCPWEPVRAPCRISGQEGAGWGGCAHSSFACHILPRRTSPPPPIPLHHTVHHPSPTPALCLSQVGCPSLPGILSSSSPHCPHHPPPFLCLNPSLLINTSSTSFRELPRASLIPFRSPAAHALGQSFALSAVHLADVN